MIIVQMFVIFLVDEVLRIFHAVDLKDFYRLKVVILAYQRALQFPDEQAVFSEGAANVQGFHRSQFGYHFQYRLNVFRV
jgi:hypothetical protein